MWIKDLQRALRVTRAMQFGTVWVNTHGDGSSEMPWGSYKQSGDGRDLSVYVVEDYTQIKHIMAAF